jgi:hypothetical protein
MSADAKSTSKMKVRNLLNVETQWTNSLIGIFMEGDTLLQSAASGFRLKISHLLI